MTGASFNVLEGVTRQFLFFYFFFFFLFKDMSVKTFWNKRTTLEKAGMIGAAAFITARLIMSKKDKDISNELRYLLANSPDLDYILNNLNSKERKLLWMNLKNMPFTLEQENAFEIMYGTHDFISL